MKNLRLLLISGFTLGLASVAHATCTGGGDACNAPRNGTITGHTATTISESVQNAATPNPGSSVYYFQVTTLGSAQNNGTLDRNTVIVFTEDFGTGSANDVVAQTVKPLLANSTYHGYAKICPPGSSAPTDAGCSAWVSIGTQVTDVLTNAGFDNIARADTQPLQFTARTNNSVVDQTNVIAWITTQLASTEVGNCTLAKNLQPFPGSGNASLTITSADCNTLAPNRPYTLKEHLVYDPTQAAPDFTSGVFYTQAKDPVALDPVASVTHCSATLNFQNAAADPANPSDTIYSVNVGGPVASGSATQTKAIGGTGAFGDQNSVTFTNLQAGTAYTPSVTALNRGGSSWLNSNPDGYTLFNTVAWGGTFNVNNVGTTTADFIAATVNTAGVQSWQIQTTPAVAGLPSGNAANLNGTHTMTGLAPNTQYTVQIKITEASGCFSILPVTPVAFTTTPTVPQTFAMVANSPTQLGTSWDTNGNPGNTIYQVQYCTPTLGQNCATANSSAGASSLNINGVLPETVYVAQVKALTIGGGLDSAFSNSATATTPNQAPTIVSGPTVNVWITSATLTVTAKDNAGPAGLSFTWAPLSQAGATLTSATGVTNTSGSGPTGTATNSTFLTFTSAGSYSGTVTVTDHSGSGLSIQVPWSTTSTPIPTTVVVTPANPAVGTGGTQQFSVTVNDQNGVAISPTPAVTWSVVAPANGNTIDAAGLFHAQATGSYTVRATVNSNGVSGTTTVNVSATLPIFSVAPTATVFVTSVTLNAQGTVFGNHTLDYTWALVSPTGATIDFDANNGHPAGSTEHAILHAAGTYTISCTLTDETTQLTATQNVTFTLSSVLSSITVTPDGVTIKALDAQTFIANGKDQFGQATSAGAVAWSTSGGNISGSGVFSSPSLGSNITVRARNGSVSGSATVSVIDFNISAAYAYPVPFKSTRDTVVHFVGLKSQAEVRIYSTAGREVFSVKTQDHFDWDTKNSSGDKVASGVYFYFIESPEGKKDGKLIIIQ